MVSPFHSAPSFWSLIILGIISPSPACRRALEWVCDALEKQGHEVFELCAQTARMLSFY